MLPTKLLLVRIYIVVKLQEIPLQRTASLQLDYLSLKCHSSAVLSTLQSTKSWHILSASETHWLRLWWYLTHVLHPYLLLLISPS